MSDPSSRQLYAKDVVESAGEIRLRDRRRQGHKLRRGKDNLKSIEHRVGDLASLRPLHREAEYVLLGLIVGIALLETVEIVNLSLG